jgi:hypothetical protein
MMRRMVVVVALVMAIVTGTALVPRRAAAVDSLVYIIPAAVGGVAVVAVLIAILMADRKGEPELDLADRLRPPREPAGGVHFAPHCGPTAAGMPLLCW